MMHDPARPAHGGSVEAEPDETMALIDHILARYHEVHRRELPHLIRLARDVEAGQGSHPAAPSGLSDLLECVLADIESHQQKEELVLFPLMRSGGHPMIDAPIGRMRHEHDEHLANIARLEAAMDGGPLSPGASPSWDALRAGVSKFIDDLKRHIHLENDILFPRFSH